MTNSDDQSGLPFKTAFVMNSCTKGVYAILSFAE